MMVFMLTLLKIYYIFYPNLFALPEPQEDEFVIVKTERLKNEENKVLFRGHILNHIFSKLSRQKNLAILETHYKQKKSGSDYFFTLTVF